jgi:two-component system, OmpR family, sensor histidine kinase MtrB
MRTRWPPILLPRLTVRVLVLLWAVSMFVAWAALVVGWLAAERQLERLDNQVVVDARGLDAAHELELAILAHRREDLLWEATGLDYHRRYRNRHFLTAREKAAGLGHYVTTPEERAKWAQIQESLSAIQEPPMPRGTIEEEAQRVYTLLDLVGEFQAKNKSQMQDSIVAAEQLRQTMSNLAINLSVVTALALAAGAWGIVRRVVYPTLALTDAARAFGRGDFTARVGTLSDDELGTLSRTFNNMAADIANREDERMRFVAMVVHDLKNPVLAIEMAGRLLQGCAHDEQERRKYLDAITAEARRLRRIVRDLTDDIQVANGRFSVRRTEVDLVALVKQLVQTQAEAFASHQVVLQMDGECIVSADAERIERVVQNLLSNAVKYSPAGTRVLVQIEPRERFAFLSVQDEGPGICKEDQQVIFQPFGRGRSANTLAEGTGIGLYIVKQIVEAHGGTIEVESELGYGSTFHVRLPLADGASSESLSADVAAGRISGAIRGSVQ